MSGKLNNEIGESIRKNLTWPNLPVHIKQVSEKHFLSIFLFIFFIWLKNYIIDWFTNTLIDWLSLTSFKFVWCFF